MAEFKLGRLRFVWKGAWLATTLYVKDDIVRNGGKSYVCLNGHTANTDFYSDLNAATPKWSLMTDGVEWKNTWQISTYYKLSDIVKFGAKEYICIAPHTSSSTDNSGFYTDLVDHWQLLVDGVEWKNTWQTSTYYKLSDIVKFGAKEYICIAPHTSSSTANSGFYTDLNAATPKWALMVDGTEWKDTWQTSTYYKLNDIVTYGGITYICTSGHTSQGTLELDQSKWSVFVKGFNYIGDWSDASYVYKVNDVVRYGPNLWICITAHTSSTIFDETTFTIFVQGLEFENNWSDSVSYVKGEVVTYGGYTYSSLTTNNLNNAPSTSTTKWGPVTTGFKMTGEWNNSTSYKVGNVVTYGGYTYVSTKDNSNSDPSSSPTKWELLSTGFISRGTWDTAQHYRLGDIITYVASSYICKLAHESASANRPDNDATGTYWNLLSQGSANSFNTTAGDITYRGTSGSDARLPVGTNTQILNVVNGLPEWTSDVIVGTISGPTGVAINNFSPEHRLGESDTTVPTQHAVKQYVDSLHAATFEPTGFNRGNPLTMGIMEFSLDGTTIHKIDENSNYTSRTDGKFATGTTHEITATANTFVIYPVTGEISFVVWQSGTPYTFVTLQQLTLSSMAGSTFYFINNGVLTSYTSMSGDYIQKQAFTALVYINDVTNEVVVFGDERHGITMDGATHLYLHTTSGTRFKSGLGAAGITAGGTTFTSLASGAIWDEDIQINIPSTTTAPMLYRNASKWSLASSSNTISHIVNSVAQYNSTVSTGVYSLSGIPSGKYAVMYIMATNCRINPFTRMMGQYVFDTLADARESAQTEPRDTSTSGLPITEFLWVGAVIVNSAGVVQTLDNGTYYVDLRYVNISSGTNTSAAVQAVAADTYYNNETSGLASSNVQGAIDSIAMVCDSITMVWSFVNSASTTTVTAQSGHGYMIDTSATAVTVTLPASPSAGNTVNIADYSKDFGSEGKAVTVARNGSNIMGLAQNLTIDVTGARAQLYYVDSTRGWIITNLY